MAVYERQCGSILLMSQDMANNPRGEEASNELILLQTLKISPLKINVANALHLNQRLSLNRTIVNMSVSNQLLLAQTAVRGQVVSASNLLSLSHATRTIDFTQPSQSLTLLQSAIATLCKVAANSLTLNQSIILSARRSPVASNHLILQSYVKIYFFKCNESAVDIQPPLLGDL